jgi:hypothetical protein
MLHKLEISILLRLVLHLWLFSTVAQWKIVSQRIGSADYGARKDEMKRSQW